MKLSKTATVEKEEFVRNLLKSTKLSANSINESVKAQFGSPLRINRLYELQREVRRPDAEKKPKPPKVKEMEAAPVTVANRKASKPVSIDVALPRIFRFVPGESPAELLTRAVEDLRQNGLSTAVVATSTDRYALIDSAS